MATNDYEYRKRNYDWEKGHPARKAKYLKLVKYMNFLQKTGVLKRALPEQPTTNKKYKHLQKEE